MSTLPKDIEDIDLRIKKIKNSQRKDMSSKIYPTKELSMAFRIVLEFVIAIFIGISIGYILDMLLKTKFIFLIIFAIFGCIAGCLNVYNIDKSLEKNKGKIDG